MAELDLLAEEFMSTDSQINILEQARRITATLEDNQKQSAGYYIKVMERVIDKGKAWVSKEVERLEKIVHEHTFSIVYCCLAMLPSYVFLVRSKARQSHRIQMMICCGG